MQSGLVLGHYTIEDRLGVGGMGEVWAAVDNRLGRRVALKFLPPAFTADPGRHARFHAEAKALAAFSHPHVAGIHSLEEMDGHHFLVMELVAGADLSERLAAGALSEGRALAIARQIALALEAAHGKGIVHRDLKPANVKVGDDDRVKVLDFGLAKIYQGDDAAAPDPGSLPTVTSEMTVAGSVLGTAAYMSPEQARGKAVDRRTDIWAFGCVLFEMLTGVRAHPGETASDTIAAVLRGEPDWSGLPDGLSPGVRRLLRRCLRKDPTERLHDIADARLEIDAVLGGEDDGATDGPAAGDDAPPARSRRGVVIAAVVGWVAVAALVGLKLGSPAAETPVPARILNLTYSGRDWAPDASPDGKTIAFVSDRDGRTRIWIKQLATGNEAPLTQGADDRPRFSPDGSHILFARDEGFQRDLYRQALLGGNPRRLMSDVVEADWSPDGNQVVFSRMTPVDGNNIVTIGVADIQSGEERIVRTIENRLVYGLRWVPGSRRISFSETSLTGNKMIANVFWLHDLDTGDERTVEATPWTGAFTGPHWSADGSSVLVGQGIDLLSFMSGAPALAMQIDVEAGTSRPLFWSTFRMPRGGWGYTSIDAINDHQVVFDEHEQYSELMIVDLVDGRPAGPARLLTASMGRDRQPVFSPDGTKVLFSSNRAGNIDLWTVDLATREVRQVTDDPAHDWDPAYTPDGRHLLWSSDRGGHMEVWMANADAGNARQVTNDGEDAENPTMTPDGEWVVHSSGASAKIGIWRIRPDGSEASIIAPGANLLPEVSPDGRYALYSVVRSLDFVIKVVEIATGEDVDFEVVIPVLKRDRDVVYGRARWAADGRGIVYIGQSPEGTSGIFWQEFRIGHDTLDTRIPLAGFAERYETESLGVAPDGSAVVFAAQRNRRIVKLVEDVRLVKW
ncbi:PD40 domain-containing protein [bacterium]|nr:PD40 domain-containing protein [bacterium]